MNTITKNELIEADRLATIYAGELRGKGWTPSESAAVTPDRVMRLEFQNGSLNRACLPVAKLAAWARTFPGNPEFNLEFSPDCTEAGGAVTIRRDAACAVFKYHVGSAKTHASLTHVPAIRFDDDNHTLLSFRLVKPSDMGDLAAQLKTTKAAKAFAKFLSAETGAKRNLKQAASEHCALVTEFAGGYNPAKAKARAALNARRQLRRALANPETLPAWYPETYQGEHYETRNVLNADGTRAIDPFYMAEYKKEIGVAEYVGALPNIREFWFQTESVKVTLTSDARAQFAEYVAAIAAARQALADYKPRVTSSKPVYQSHRRGWVKPVLKQDKLAEAVKTAKENLKSLIRRRFQSYLESQGLPAALACSYFGRADGFSRARIAVRRWPARKAALAAEYVAALNARRKAQGKALASGAAIRARAILANGEKRDAVLMSADFFAGQLEKAAALGASVEVLESCNPAYPVGVIAPKTETAAVAA